MSDKDDNTEAALAYLKELDKQNGREVWSAEERLAVAQRDYEWACATRKADAAIKACIVARADGGALMGKKVGPVWERIADIRDQHDAECAAAEEKIEQAQRAAAVLHASFEADMAVAQWIILREMLGDLSADDKAALLDTPPRSTRRLLYRQLIRRTHPLTLTHKGVSAASLLRGEPPPPHVIMRAVWRLWFSDAAISGWFSPPYRQMLRRVMPDVIPPDLLDVWAPPPATVMRDTWHRVAEGDCTPEMAAAEAAHVEAAMAEHPALATCPDGLIWRALMGRP